MTLSVTKIPRHIRKQLKQIVHRSPDRDHVRRALAILRLQRTGGLRE